MPRNGRQSLRVGDQQKAERIIEMIQETGA
jgi:hypothetical protein